MAQETEQPDREKSRAADAGATAAAEGAGEFTRIFRSLSPEPEAAPVTGVFSVTAASTPSQPTRQVAPPAFSASPHTPEQAPNKLAEPNPTTKPAAGSAAPEGFTQIFQQIPRPTSTPPKITKPQDEVPASGDFTRIFSSLGSAQQPATPAASSEAEGLPAPAALAAPVSAAPPSASASTAPALAAPPASAPGEFTQMFSSLGSSPEPTRTPALAASEASAAAPTSASAIPLASASPASAPPASAPAFGAVPEAPGSFTQLFQQTAASAAKPNPLPDSRLPDSEHHDRIPEVGPVFGAAAPSGSFTQMFQSLSETPEQHSAPSPPVQGLQFGGSHSTPNFAPASFVPSAAPSGGGEFTRLMQSLEQSPAQPAAFFPAGPAAPFVGSASQPFAAQPEAPLPFFNEAPHTSGASEYTRVMRGASREALRPAASASIAAPVAPGMAIAPAKVEDAPAAKPAGISKNLMILLVIFNVLLVLALIVLAVMLLHRH